MRVRLAAFFTGAAGAAGSAAAGGAAPGSASTTAARPPCAVRFVAFLTRAAASAAGSPSATGAATSTTGAPAADGGANSGLARSIPRRGGLKLTTTNVVVSPMASTSRALRGAGSPR